MDDAAGDAEGAGAGAGVGSESAVIVHKTEELFQFSPPIVAM